MKKLLLFAVMAVLLSFTPGKVSAQDVDLRSVVAVVYPNYYESSKNFMKEFGAMLRKDGYRNAADWLENYLEGGFGTGFTYQDPKTKQMFVITNRHVVTLAESVTVEFLASDKSVVKYERCPVVAIHDKMDLAIVALPHSLQRPSLLFYQDEVKDGEEVFTASYPAFGDNPSWQYGKGVVSNSKFYSPVFEDYKDISLIQHTAQADAGSSGSPLLIKSADAEGGYTVVGVTTWKATSRENTNFAIPAQHVIDFINGHISSKIELSDDQLLTVAGEFVDALGDYKEIIPFISYEYLSKITPRDFNDWYNACSKEVKEEIKKNFNDLNPIEGVRTALAYAIQSKVGKKPVKVLNVKKNIVNMRYDNKPATSEWVLEQGKLRVKDLSFFNAKTAGKNGVVLDYGYRTSFAIGATQAFGPSPNWMYHFAIGNTKLTFMTYDFMFRYGSIPLTKIRKSNYTGQDEQFDFHYNGFGLDVNYGAQVPIRVGLLYLIPYAKPFFGLNINVGSEQFILNYGLRTGLETGIRFQDRKYLLLGLGYKLTGFKSFGDFDSEDDKILKLHALDVYLKITL